MIKCVNLTCKTQKHLRQWPEQPALFFKFQGNEMQIQDAIKRTSKIVTDNGGNKLVFAKDDKEKADLWYARKAALWSALDYLPGSRCITTDVCVPISNFPKLIAETKDDMDKSNLIAPSELLTFQLLETELSVFVVYSRVACWGWQLPFLDFVP